MPTISVIIPIYNVSEYLRRCLESVQFQTYKNLQVILVNDGSTDDSPHIAQNFVDNDARFKIIHQENGGLSAARNTGLRLAQGDFVFYLDSDDILHEYALENMLKVAEEHQVDLVQMNFYYDYPKYLLYTYFFDDEIQILSQKEAYSKLIEQKELKNFAWGKLIKSSIARKHVFPLNRYFEDTLWICEIMQDVHKIAILREPYLYYLQRNTSISGHFSMRNKDQMFLLDKRLDFFKEMDAQLYEKALHSFKKTCQQHYQWTQNFTQEDRLRYGKEIERYRVKYQWEESEFLRERGILQKVKQIKNKLVNRISPEVQWIKQYKS